VLYSQLSFRGIYLCAIPVENQFFCSSASPDDKGPLKNKVAMAITERVLSAARNGEKFKVVIVIPAIPGFAGDLKSSAGTLAIMVSFNPSTELVLCRYVLIGEVSYFVSV
jgi:hypothetical protein